MRYAVPCLLAASLVLSGLVACDQAMTPTGIITVKNEDGQKWPLLVTTDDKCTLGTHTSINPNTQTTFDIELSTKSYVCVNEEGPAIEVENGVEYKIEGGRFGKRQTR